MPISTINARTVDPLGQTTLLATTLPPDTQISTLSMNDSVATTANTGVYLDTKTVIIIVLSGVIIILLLTITIIAIIILVLKKRSSRSSEHDYDYIDVQPLLLSRNTSASEGEPIESRSPDATTVQSGDTDSDAGDGIRMQENCVHRPVTNFIFTINQAYGNNIAIAPEIETENNIAYQ